MLKGQTAVITGASRGIGRRIAEYFAENGADIAIVYSGNADAAEEALAAVSSFGIKAKCYQCDVSDFSSVKMLCENIIEEFGGADILVNNAGITKDGSLRTMSEDDFDRVISVNLKGAFNMTKHLVAYFMKQRKGNIINVSSIIGISGNAGQANYSASKAGIIGLTKSTAKELASRNIRCNAIAPGFIQTDMTAAIPEKNREAMLNSIPMKRFGTADDVASLALFLASDKSAYITGEVIKVDGGMLI